MSKFKVLNYVDAWKVYTVEIEADSPEEARDTAKNEDQDWQESHVAEFDDRQFVVFKAEDGTDDESKALLSDFD